MTNTPRNTREISLDWLNQVFMPLFNTPILRFDAEIIGEGVGILGELARLHLHYSSAAEAATTGAPGSVIAKFATPVEEARAVGSAYGFYEMEHLFYRELRPELNIRAPIAYANVYDATSGHCVLLMSDIPGKVFDQVAGCPPAQAIQAAHEIARLHAFGLTTCPPATLPWLRSGIKGEMLETAIEQVTQIRPIALKHFDGKLPERIRGIIDDFPAILRRISSAMDGYPHTIIHGDLRVENLIFDAEEKLTIIDWQVVLSSPGAFDLTYFMTQSMTTEDRRQHEPAIIAAYQSSLQAAGAEFNADEFDIIKRYSSIQCLLYPIIGSVQLDSGHPRSRDLIFSMLQRACAAVEDYDALELL